MRVSFVALALLSLAACDSTPREQVSTIDTADTAGPAVAATASGRTAGIETFLQKQYPDADAIQYVLAWRDLSGDGTDEAIIHLAGREFCGTGGCSTLVLTPNGAGWLVVGDIGVSRTPVTVLKSRTSGWGDLTVDVSGGGMPGRIALLRFDGEAYPANPTVPPAETAEGHGEILIAQEPAFTTLGKPRSSGE